MIECLSFGAGVQSTTLLCMSCDGVLPKLDFAIFADTQAEPEAVYRHLEWCKEKAARAGIQVLIGTAGNLRQDLIYFWGTRRSADGKRHASIPAFIKNPPTVKKVWEPDESGNLIDTGRTETTHTRGMVRRQCTGTYKIDVIELITRRDILGLRRGQRWPTNQVVRQWIGISADEHHRRRTSQRPAIGLWYPLIDELTMRPGGTLLDRGYIRQDCLDWMRKAGYPLPPRSACTFCPFHSDEEWARMKFEDPASFADACEVDRKIRLERSYQDSRGELRGEPYLHSSLIPLEMVQFDPASDKSEGRGMANECQGMCGV